MVVRPRTRQNMCVQNDSSNCAFFSSSKSRKWKRSRSRGPLSATTNYMAPRWCMAARASGMIEYLLHRTTVGPTANQHRVSKTHGCPQTIKDALRQPQCIFYRLRTAMRFRDSALVGLLPPLPLVALARSAASAAMHLSSSRH